MNGPVVPRRGQRAVVLGGSMAGLLAARVLSEAYDEVVLVERDELPGTAANRRGVPQGRHAHTLLPSGSRCLERLLPGLLDDLARDGVPVLAELSRLYFCAGGHPLHQNGRLAEAAYQVNRCYLEHQVRARVRDIHNVRVRDKTTVAGLVADSTNNRVVAVRLAGPDRPAGQDRTGREVLAADLVADALGRGGRTPALLDELGYARAPEDRMPIDVVYVSRRVAIPPAALPETLVLVGPRAGRAKGLALLAVEDGTWICTVFGYRGQHPPRDWQDALAFIADLVPAHVRAALDRAQPLEQARSHRFPASRRRHYERLRRFPGGLLVFGDAIVSLNPVYGQGMSVTALQAMALRDCLAREPGDLARAFFKAAAKPVDVAWQLASGPDLTLPEVPGPRPLPVRLVNAYIDRLQAAAGHDRELTEQFLNVIALVEPPTRLFRPWVLRRVLADRGRRAEPAPTRPAPA